MQDALKYNYDNWKVWENFAGVAAKVGEWEQLIRATHRLLDLKGKYADLMVPCLPSLKPHPSTRREECD